MSGFRVVLAKECRDNLRDRRTVTASFAMAVLGPALFVALMAFVLQTSLGESREGFRLTVVGSEHAPGLMAHLARYNVTVIPASLENPRQAVADGREDLVLVIDPDYPRRFRSGQSNAVSLIYDSSRMGAIQRHFQQVRQMVGQYAQQIGMLRLQLRGIDPAVLAPVRVAAIDTASPAARALSILATLPYLLVLVIFMGGFYIAIDATAGEREHGSLEPLLSQPVSRTALVLGKIAAASVFSAASLVLFLISLSLSLPFVPLHRVGMSLELGLTTCTAIFLIALPLIALGAALLTVVASFAKSYKEAQTYLTLVVLVPTLPLIVTQLLDLDPGAALMMVPSLSQATLITSLIKGDPLQWQHLVLSFATTSAVAGLLAWVAMLLYRRERMLV